MFLRSALIAQGLVVHARAFDDYVFRPFHTFLDNIWGFSSVILLVFLVFLGLILVIFIVEYLRLYFSGDMNKEDSPNEYRFNYFWPKKWSPKYQAHKLDEKAKEFEQRFPERYDAPETVIEDKVLRRSLRKRNPARK